MNDVDKQVLKYLPVEPLEFDAVQRRIIIPERL